MIRFIYRLLRRNPLFERECSLVVNIGDMTVVDFQYGTSAEVEFDNLGIYMYCKINGVDPRCLYFVHVHPDGCRFLSPKDKICMQSLKNLLGVDVVFDIITFSKGSVDWSYLQDTGYTLYKEYSSLLYSASYSTKIKDPMIGVTGAECSRRLRGMDKFVKLK